MNFIKHIISYKNKRSLVFFIGPLMVTPTQVFNFKYKKCKKVWLQWLDGQRNKTAETAVPVLIRPENRGAAILVILFAKVQERQRNNFYFCNNLADSILLTVIFVIFMCKARAVDNSCPSGFYPCGGSCRAEKVY